MDALDRINERIRKDRNYEGLVAEIRSALLGQRPSLVVAKFCVPSTWTVRMMIADISRLRLYKDLAHAYGRLYKSGLPHDLSDLVEWCLMQPPSQFRGVFDLDWSQHSLKSEILVYGPEPVPAVQGLIVDGQLRGELDLSTEHGCNQRYRDILDLTITMHKDIPPEEATFADAACAILHSMLEHVDCWSDDREEIAADRTHLCDQMPVGLYEFGL